MTATISPHDLNHACIARIKGANSNLNLHVVFKVD